MAGAVRPSPTHTMTWLYFTLPLMVAGIAAALLPVLVGLGLLGVFRAVGEPRRLY